MSNSWSYRLMNDAGTVNIPLVVVSLVNNRYVNVSLTEQVEETWTLSVDPDSDVNPVTDWQAIETKLEALTLAMLAADKAARDANSDHMVWLEATRPDTTIRRVLIYGGEFALIEPDNPHHYEGAGSDVAWTFRRHPLAEGVNEDSVFSVTNYRYTENPNDWLSVRVVGRAQDTGATGSEEFVLVTEAPARISQFKITHAVVFKAQINVGGAGFNHEEYVFGSLPAYYPVASRPLVLTGSPGLGGASSHSVSSTTMQEIYSDTVLLNTGYRGTYRAFLRVINSPNTQGAGFAQIVTVRAQIAGSEGAEYSFSMGENTQVFQADMGVVQLTDQLWDSNGTANVDVTVFAKVEDINGSSLTRVAGQIVLVPFEHYLGFSNADMPFNTANQIVVSTLPTEMVRGVTENGSGQGISTVQLSVNSWHLRAGSNNFLMYAQSVNDDGGLDLIDGESGGVGYADLEFRFIPRYYTL